MTKIALGLNVRSGWAAAVALAEDGARPLLLDRARLELVTPGTEAWARQPFHAAEGLAPRAAHALLRRAIAAARRLARRELAATLDAQKRAGRHAVACAVLARAPASVWSGEQILSIRAHMDRRDGALFRDALCWAVTKCGLAVISIPTKELAAHARGALAAETVDPASTIAALGVSAGPPWGQDHRRAALAAWIALRSEA